MVQAVIHGSPPDDFTAALLTSLNDPGAAIKPGAVIGVSACTGQRQQSWFRP